MRSRTVFLTFACALSVSAWSQIGVSANQSILSAYQDTSNLQYSGTTYTGWLSHSGADPDTYINSVAVAYGAGWDPDLDLYYETTQIYHDSDVYTLGTPISGDQFWYLGNLVNRGGQTYNVDAGIYDFQFQFFGGLDSQASDLLGAIDYQIEVYPRLELEVTGTVTPDTVAPGQSFLASMTVRNLSTTRDLKTTTWGITFGDWTNNMDFAWQGNWFDQTIAPGDSRTDDHSQWTVRSNAVPGDYYGNLSVVGGLYAGDFHWAMMNPRPLIHIVPEPASAALLGLGVLLVLRRARK